MSSKPLVRREWMAVEELSAFLAGLFQSPTESIQRVLELKKALIAAMYPGEPEPDQETWAAADKIANRMLAAYTTVPHLARDDEGFGFIGQSALLLSDRDIDWLEARAVQQVIYLANQGILHQLISCGNCAKIFLPTRVGQKNCGAQCSKKAYESKPEFRPKRNEWARENYRRAKERDARNLKVVISKRNKPPRDRKH